MNPPPYLLMNHWISGNPIELNSPYIFHAKRQSVAYYNIDYVKPALGTVVILNITQQTHEKYMKIYKFQVLYMSLLIIQFLSNLRWLRKMTITISLRNIFIIPKSFEFNFLIYRKGRRKSYSTSCYCLT